MVGKDNKVDKSEDVLIKFLKRTKNGDYAPIEKSSLRFSRIKEETEDIQVSEEEYYYSLT